MSCGKVEKGNSFFFIIRHCYCTAKWNVWKTSEKRTAHRLKDRQHLLKKLTGYFKAPENECSRPLHHEDAAVATASCSHGKDTSAGVFAISPWGWGTPEPAKHHNVVQATPGINHDVPAAGVMYCCNVYCMFMVLFYSSIAQKFDLSVCHDDLSSVNQGVVYYCRGFTSWFRKLNALESLKLHQRVDALWMPYRKSGLGANTIPQQVPLAATQSFIIILRPQ